MKGYPSSGSLVLVISTGTSFRSPFRTAQSRTNGEREYITERGTHDTSSIIASFDAEELVEHKQHSRHDAMLENVGTSALRLWLRYEYTLYINFCVISGRHRKK